MINNDRGQTLMNKYVWVIETIYRAKKISFKELNDKWLIDREMSRGIDLSKRTFANWCYAIWDMFGISIVNENRGDYRYYIDNVEDLRGNGLRSWLFKTFCVSNTLANSQSIKERILLEYVPSGQDYLKPIIDAMKENRVLSITYQSYWNNEENDIKMQPYCMKLFKQRWYLVAKPDYAKAKPYIFSLDRILSLRTTDETFRMPEDWSAKDYFKDSFGIFVDTKVKPQVVKLKVNAGQANYIRDLRLHESQEEIEQNQEYSIFRYRLRPQFDFIQELLWHGSEVEVLEPIELRNEMTRIIDSMRDNYHREENPTTD